ncbi:hypothetical protein [Brachyspira alvinipulli]|uniref:hypothetical protein n=1 Tax=Brachyspira alvinipulli TaxID=84379 RepID=UPI0004857B47|nr:hypothetical protein [Brachyspira alvinipulli]
MTNYLFSSNLNHIYFVISNLHHDNSIVRISKNLVKIKKYSRNFMPKSSNRSHADKKSCIKKNILKKMSNNDLF